MNILRWLKEKSGHVGNLMMMWMPLSLVVFISYIFQRGLVIISKTAMAPPELLIGMPYYMAAIGISALLIGLLCDNFNTRKLFLLLCFAGFVGLLIIPYSPLGFGILFGASASMTRCGAFSGPMKLFDKDLSWNIVWQSVSKSIAPVVIPLFLLAFLAMLGWSWVIAILASLYLIAGILIYKIMPDDVMEKWNFSDIKQWVKSWRVWAVFAAMVATPIYQIFMSRMIPTLQTHGYTMTDAVSIVLLLGFLEVGGRFLFSWIADKWDCHEIICYIVNFVDVFLTWLVLPVFPLIAIAIHFIANGGSTPTNWPTMRKAVGAQYVSTFYGITVFVSFIMVAFLFNK